MYQEVAFDPRCLEEFHYYGLLKTEFGFEKGRYIVAPVKPWAKEAFKAAKNSVQLKPVQRKSITNYLNKLQREKINRFILLPKYRKDSIDPCWNSWCEKQIALAPFQNIISENFQGAINYNDILESNESWLISPTITVDKNVVAIISIIKPLMKLGGIITIVDQYFRLAENRVLDEILSEVNSSSCISSIKLVTSIQTANPEQSFTKQYRDKYTNSPCFELVIVPERFFHDRYIITSFGAIKGGHGFSEAITQGAQADKLSISLCGESEAKEVLDWIDKVVKSGKAKYCILNDETQTLRHKRT